MKKLYLFLIFSIFFVKVNAQWVTIPDPNFEAFLQQNYPQCMNGNQMDTTCSAIVNEGFLDCTNKNISDLTGIQYFDSLNVFICYMNPIILWSQLPLSLTELRCGGYGLTSLPILPPNLISLYLSSSNLTTLPALPTSLINLYCTNNYSLTNLSPLPPALNILVCNNNILTTLPTLPTSLIRLECQNNQINTIPNFSPTLLEIDCSNNQLASLPQLPTFLSILKCSANQLTSLPLIPASLKNLNCKNNNLTSLPPLDSLEIVDCSFNLINSLPALPNSLVTIKCNNNQLVSLPTFNVNLEYIDCSYNQIITIPSLPNSLKYLLITSNVLDTLPTLPDSLLTLRCQVNNLNSLPDLPSSLDYLACDDNNLLLLPTLPINLKSLTCSENNLVSLPQLPSSLLSLNCKYNALTSLPQLPNNIRYLHCGYNQITTLPELPTSIISLTCHNNQLTSIPELPDTLFHLLIYSNYNLNCLPKLKNIKYEFKYYNTNIECLPNYPNIFGNGPIGSISPPLSTYPICDIYNQNNCDVYWNLRGEIYHDSIMNCLKDTNEHQLKNIKVQLYKNGNLIQQVYSNDTGLYVFDTDTGTFTYSVDTIGLPVSVTCPVSGFYTSNITPINLFKDSMDFGVLCKSFDVGAAYVNQIVGQFFPANYATIKVGAGDMAGNFGLSCASGVSGSLIIEINGPASFISSLPGALIPIVVGDSLTYLISDFGTIKFDTDFQFIIQTDTTAQAGDQICFSVHVFPFTGDLDSTNNFLQHCFTVVNSFDPNEKAVSPSGVILPDHEWLTYTIYFQNTGTAPAQHIYILDTLDANLDVSTFTLLSYSHDNLTQVLGDVVKFNFPNINLPDSTNDEPNSHGYVQYKIKLNPGLPIGSVISNTAYNFFDFNPPIATNTVVNQIYFLNPTITPNNLILCPNESDTLWTQVYDSYQWFKDGNLISGANDQFIAVDHFNDSGSQFMVEVDSAGFVAQSPPVLVDGWAFLPPFVITEGTFTIGSMGEVMICPGDTVYLILGQPYDTNIQWIENGIAIPGATNDTLVVTQAGLYHVSGAPSQCPNYVQGLFTDIEVIIAPPLSPTITPNNLILCPNESDTLWTQQFGTYQWYKDGNLIPGATNQYLVVEQFNDAGSQFYVVVSEGNCTGSSTQVLVDSWIFLLPYVISEGTFTIGPHGEMLMCPGDTAYLILGQPYDTNIQWTESGNIIPGANNDTLVVTQSGNYHVSGAPSTCPNFIQNLGVTIEVIVQGPPTPVITFTGNSLQTQSGYTYQWYYQGNPVGTNSNTLISQGVGAYTVTITDAQGCTAGSTPFILTAIIENSISGIINVNYNSITGTLHITRSETTTETEIFVLDVLGRVIADEKMAKGISDMQIKLTNIKPGIYFVNLSEGGSVKFFVE